MDDRARQFQSEDTADTVAASEKLKQLKQDALKGSLELPRASQIVANMFETVADYLNVEMALTTRGRGGAVKNWLRTIPSELAAVIALRESISILGGTGAQVNVQTLASSIGRLWELEIRIKQAEKVNPMYMQKIHEQITDRHTTDKGHLRKVYNVAYERILKGELDSQLTQAEAIQLGKYGVQACMDAGLLVQSRTNNNYNMVVQFHLAPEIQEYLTGYDQSSVRSIMDKSSTAMICPPEDWTHLGDGGYLTTRRKIVNPLMGLRNVRQSERKRIREEFTAEKMPMVFEAGNYLQSVPFMLHEPTVKALERVWMSGGGILGVPTKNIPTKPECPLPKEWVKDQGTVEEQEQFSIWKRTVVAWYETVSTWKGHTRELMGHMKVSKAHVGHPIWFPVYMDTRGRWYYRGTPNPQGSDLAKSALHFAEKKALGHRGLFWLKVHIANCYGFDKERFVDRAAWTDKHWADIERALDEPENHVDVWGTDAPWCMFSAAWELREAYRSGEPATYKTGIVIHMDATCSGLQHFSALLRDPVGARYVNLNDELQCGPKQDIYSRVSTMALQAMERDLQADDAEVREMAQWWLEVGISRSMAKKPVR